MLHCIDFLVIVFCICEKKDQRLYWIVFFIINDLQHLFCFRFAKNKLVSSENYVTVMIRLHLAHGKEYCMKILTVIGGFVSCPDKKSNMNILLVVYIFRTLPLHWHQDEGQPSLPGGDDTHDHLLVMWELEPSKWKSVSTPYPTWCEILNPTLGNVVHNQTNAALSLIYFSQLEPKYCFE